MIAISVNTLGKKFKLYNSPMGRFLEYLSLGKITRHTDFWALEDISFEIPAGTTLGILGQNGSGKSTLLSILAGVLEQSAGSFAINGKVSAILELGSGFHLEFSGRDNVYMYGSIMGLSKSEIDARFDEIVRFSELGDFIDQPLRTYSSGMTVRLAFSVAVNVDADILIVDEALAVGDAIFQHRCFRKIREMQANGKTILYVGHDADAVRNLCTQALLLDGGRIIERGDPNYVVNKYYALIAEREQAYSERNLAEHGEIPGEGYETVYSFVQNLNTAKVITPPTIPASEQTIEVNSSPRKVIFAHPPSEITYSVLLPPGSSLAFAIGIMPGAWDKIPQGVKFDVEIFSEGIKENIFSRVLQPKRNIGDRGWHNYIVPLEPFSGKKVSIIFRTSGSGNDLSYGWSAWGWGKIISFQTREDHSYNKSDEKNEIQNNIENKFPDTSPAKLRIGNKKVKITKIEILDTNGCEKKIIESGEEIFIKIHIFFNENIQNDLAVGFIIKNKFCDVFGINNHMKNICIEPKFKGDSLTINYSLKMNLAAGIYSMNFGCVLFHQNSNVEILDRCYDRIFLKINSKRAIVGIVNLDTKISIDSY